MSRRAEDNGSGKRELTPAQQKMMRRVGKNIFNSLKKTFVRTGVIDPTGLTARQLEEQAFDYIIPKLGKIDFLFVIDHTSTLLRYARQMASSNKSELAILLYATWFEHWLNHAIAHAIETDGGTHNEASAVIRGTTLDAKLQLVPFLLKARALEKKHKDRVVRVSELRNAFVHYKWKSRHVDSPDPKDEEKALRGIETTVKYLNRYEHKYIYKGMKLRPSLVSRTQKKGPILVSSAKS